MAAFVPVLLFMLLKLQLIRTSDIQRGDGDVLIPIIAVLYLSPCF